MGAPGHRWDEHTADLALTAWGDDERAMLLEAGRAVVAALSEDAPRAASPGAHVGRDLELDGIDAEDRLVQWLNEVLYLATAEHLHLVDARLELAPPGGLRAAVTLAPREPDAVTQEIKSASYHALSIERGEGRVQGHVVLDV